MPKDQKFNNRSQGQRLRRVNERAVAANDALETQVSSVEKQAQINEDLYALTMQNERSIKAMNARLTSVEREVRIRDRSY